MFKICFDSVTGFYSFFVQWKSGTCCSSAVTSVTDFTFCWHFLMLYKHTVTRNVKQCKEKKKNKKKVQCNLNKYTFCNCSFFPYTVKKYIWKVYLSESLVVSFQVIKIWMLLWNSSAFKAALNKLTLLTILTIWPLTFVHMSFVEIAVNANSFKLINRIQLFN